MDKTKKIQVGKIIIPGDAHPWPHEMKIARILTMAGHNVEFIPKRSIKTADILLGGVEFEIKSPKTSKANSLEHLVKRALEQSSNIIFDSSRMNKTDDDRIYGFLLRQVKTRRGLKRMIFITRQGVVVDIE